MTSLLAALASLPRIASALESLATAFGEINRRAVKAKAASRRKDKDDEIDRRISELSQDPNGPDMTIDGQGVDIKTTARGD